MDLSKARGAVTGAGRFIGRATWAALPAEDAGVVALPAGLGRTRTWAAAEGLPG